MGFVCIPCHEANYAPVGHFFVSYGPCEDCGKTGECYQCRCTMIRRPVEPAKVEAAKQEVAQAFGFDVIVPPQENITAWLELDGV